MGFGIVIVAKGLDNFPTKLRKLRALVISRVPMMLKQAGAEVARQSSEEYLSGPRPDKLGRVSGDLARSIGNEAKKGGINRINGDTITIGTNLVYARAHEQGFRGTVNVPAHERRMKVVFGRYRGTILQRVGPHSRKMNIKPRPFLSTALRDSKKPIKTIIQRMIDKSLAEVMA